MKISDIVTTQAQADNRPENTSSSPKNDAIPVDHKNEAPSCKATIEKWGGDITNESEPFRNVNLKVTH
jgi:hypothetical protein